ncbi:hypothetical protein [Acidovorax sp. SUPP3334]|uniref:hypothetical protein n=1 Tax=Acidovorax sp. SUPP3334 TaxID=2920881 RepID=UPI0023DE31CC|nr:hypothetical protein [Acidovorax sp. SUPP3334]GKT24286.1 hypothetical protein AVHM3334_14285 [Acidovorax sp. SUPP3334]
MGGTLWMPASPGLTLYFSYVEPVIAGEKTGVSTGRAVRRLDEFVLSQADDPAQCLSTLMAD